MDIEEYIALTKKERQSHIDLTTVCIEEGSQYKRKRLLAQFLNTTVPTGRILLCHACNNHKCSNLKHLYFGTDRENIVEDGQQYGTWKNVWERTLEKNGYDETCQIRSERMVGNKFGEGNKGGTKSEEHKKKIAETITRIAEEKHAIGIKLIGGRPRATPYNELVTLVKEKGFKDAAKELDISLAALKGRYYSAVKALKKD
jgi:hypothetical protein